MMKTIKYLKKGCKAYLEHMVEKVKKKTTNEEVDVV